MGHVGRDLRILPIPSDDTAGCSSSGTSDRHRFPLVRRRPIGNFWCKPCIYPLPRAAGFGDPAGPLTLRSCQLESKAAIHGPARVPPLLSSIQLPAGRRRFVASLSAALVAPAALRAQEAAPVLLGIDGEFGLEHSTSAQAIEAGVQIAVGEINAAGGVLGGRPLRVVTRDHRSIAARGLRNLREFIDMPDLVAVFGGRFSPVLIEQQNLLRQHMVPLLAVWSSADEVVDNDLVPNPVFRLSLRDSLAMPFLLQTAQRRGLARVGLLLTNTAWGRSNAAAAERFKPAGANRVAIVGTAWTQWQDRSLVGHYERLLRAGAQAIILVANDDAAAVLVREMAELPRERRLPVISHWGVAGGRFVAQAGAALQQVDFSVVQTFSFFTARPEPLQRFKAAASRRGIGSVESLDSPVGVAHAYDMTHIVAKALELAGSTDRARLRDALEQVPVHDGLVRLYAPPFTPTRHEALGSAQLLMARYRADGMLVPVSLSGR